MMLSKEQAQAILAEARLNDISAPEPSNDDELIIIAQDIYEDALSAEENGIRGDVVQTIINIGNNKLPDAPAKETYRNLPVPNDFQGELPEFPRDISVLTDRELRRLHAEFAAMLARANWLTAAGEADEQSSKQIADLKYAQAIRRASENVDLNTGKPKTVPMLEAEAASDEEVKEWRATQREHFIQVKLLKALRDNYQMMCERISREFTMRISEFAASDK